MVLVVKRFAANDKGNRFLVFDGTSGKQEAATEQHVIPLDTFIEALTSCTASPR